MFLVITTAGAQRQVAFSFLKSLQSAFIAEHPSASLPTSPPYALASFNRTLSELLAEVGKTQGYDRAREVRGEIENVRGIMSENIERVLERGERIELLVDKTGRLEVGAGEFRRRSRGLKRKMWWKNVKINVLLAFAIVFIVYLFVGFGCGLPGMFLLLDTPTSLTIYRLAKVPRQVTASPSFSSASFLHPSVSTESGHP